MTSLSSSDSPATSHSIAQVGMNHEDAVRVVWRLLATARKRHEQVHPRRKRQRKRADRSRATCSGGGGASDAAPPHTRSEEHTSELQSLMRISYAVLCLKKKKKQKI